MFIQSNLYLKDTQENMKMGLYEQLSLSESLIAMDTDTVLREPLVVIPYVTLRVTRVD
jgi:hypothetical protein